MVRLLETGKIKIVLKVLANNLFTTSRFHVNFKDVSQEPLLSL